MASKSSEKSYVLRQEGNEFYKNKKFFAALVKYNESLCSSESSSEHRGHAYANRSAVYFELKLYDKCINNIELAFKHNFPKASEEILLSRREKCKKMKKIPTEKKFFKLSSPPNKKYPTVASCLEVKTNEKFGRLVVTNEKINFGDVIAIEAPFAGVLTNKSKYEEINQRNVFQRCNFCLQDNQLDLIPCDGCCLAMFCSINCYQQAQKKFHKFECDSMSLLSASASVFIILRLFFIGFSLFDENIDALYSFIEETQKSRTTIFDVNDPTNELSKFAAFISLSRSDRIFSLSSHLAILKNSQKFYGNDEKLFAILQCICQISDHNFHGFFSGSLQSKDDLQLPIGTCCFLVASLINHSCAPNVARICVDGTLALVACRDIEPGEQLFDCYKCNFLTDDKKTRQKRMLEEFHFACDCQACTQDWPMLNYLPVKDAELLKFLKRKIKSLEKYSGEKVLREFSETINKHWKNYPAQEVCMIQKICMMTLLKLAAPKITFS